MRSFSELGVVTKKSFVGKSIFIEEVLDKEIIVEDFTIEPSTKKPGTECLWIQVRYEETHRVIFTGGSVLMDQLRQIKDKSKDLPVKAMIVRINRHFEFK